MKSAGFKREEHIKRPADFKNLFKNGKKFSTFGAKLFFLPNGLSFNRIGFPLPRGFGNAVQRNQAKRFSREIYRTFKSNLSIGFDILFLVYPPSSSEKDSIEVRQRQFKVLCEKAGLIKA